MMKRYIETALAAAVLAFGLSGPSAAQSAAGGQVKSQHGAWAVVCETPPGAPGEQCALLQTVVSEQRPEIGLVVIVLKTADKKATILRVQTPLGVVLPTQIQVAIDGRYSGNLQFMRCFADGCFAEAVLDKPDTINGQQTTLQEALSKAGTVVFSVFPTVEEGIGFEIDMKGFTEGFAALP
jgi:invasion protein IalB